MVRSLGPDCFICRRLAGGAQGTLNFDGSGPGIYVMNADGSDQRRLTRTGAFSGGDGTPRWSPDGRRIAFLRQEGPKGGSAPPAPAYVYVMNADGSGPRRLARMAQVEFRFPSWSPDGKKIVFVSERDGNPRSTS